MIRFVDLKRALALHDMQIAEHGGAPGVRDMGLLESALSRPVNISDYEATADMTRLAAAYLFGIAKNHPFFDGNKRTALAVSGLFLAINGYEITATDAQVYQHVLGVAEGSVSEEEFARWLWANKAPLKA